MKKGERKINFDQFKSALRLLAQEKYQNDDKAFNRLLELVRQAEPGTTGTTTAKTSGIYSKLTDPSLYTGSHKERFDETGKGKGLAGRDTVAKTDDLSKIVARSNRPSKRGVSNSMEDMNRQQSRPAIQPNSKSAYSSKKSLASQQSAVFDRLTDHTVRIICCHIYFSNCHRNTPAPTSIALTKIPAKAVESVEEMLVPMEAAPSTPIAVEQFTPLHRFCVNSQR